MLHKRKLPRGKVRVTFSMPALEGVAGLFLAGDFNDWSETAAPLAREADGSWSASLSLDAGRTYQFRYLDDRGEWHNDWAADAYAPNDFGGDNSVLDISAQAIEDPRRNAKKTPAKHTPAKRKPAASRFKKEKRS